jgi:hypothetical protein
MLEAMKGHRGRKQDVGTVLFCRRQACCQVTSPDGTPRVQKISILHPLTLKDYYSQKSTEQQRIKPSVQCATKTILQPSSSVAKVFQH